MAFDKDTRNKLAKLVAECRKMLHKDFSQQMEGDYGIREDGEIQPLDQLPHLSDNQRSVATILRDRIEYLASQEAKADIAMVVQRVIREQAFTVLNRFVALKMAEARGIILESAKINSKGFKVYEQVVREEHGSLHERYRAYLFSLFDEFSIDLGVLFDRFSPQGLLFPSDTFLGNLLGTLNDFEPDNIWAEDETIGWVYQYYNDQDERKKMRDASAAPRNSRELAVRNQFFTPRYVVEFLTDNTLGRIWYEMTKGQTRLTDQCRYLVRRPTEIFLSEGEDQPEENQEPSTKDQELSQEELLRQPVIIPHRPVKDPREIRLLDPACGSMHFGLYAFDLFEAIYEEAWDIAKSGAIPEGADASFSYFCSLTSDFSSKEDFLREVPRLIIEHNIHGVDIDPRAVQIAGLSLWLRAQKTWKDAPAAGRPRVRRSNIVCAEPMPGSDAMLEDFVQTLDPPLLGELVKTVFDKMQLAGEAGTLLKIEEEIRTAIDDAQSTWRKSQEELPGLEAGPISSGLRSLSSDFWNSAEESIYAALRDYAESAEAGDYQRRLFAEDAAHGFAFIDLCRKRYEAVVMNPPFGEWSKNCKSHSKRSYPDSYNDILAAFVERGGQLLWNGGQLGAITSRTCFFLSSFTKWREHIVLEALQPRLLADLGQGVMDAAMVEAAAYVLEKPISIRTDREKLTAIRLLEVDEPAYSLLNMIHNAANSITSDAVYQVDPSSFEQIPTAPFAYWVSECIFRIFVDLPRFEEDGRRIRQGLATADDFRFVRTKWELPRKYSGESWFPFAKGGSYSPFYADIHLLVNWANSGAEIKNNLNEKGNVRSNVWMLRETENKYFFQPGLTWSDRTTKMFSARIWPQGGIFSVKGSSGFFGQDNALALGLMNSRAFNGFLSMMVGAAGSAARSYQVGTLGRVPFPAIGGEALKEAIADAAVSAWQMKRKTDASNLTSNAFFCPAAAPGQLRANEAEICLEENAPIPSLSEAICEWSNFLRNANRQVLESQNQIDELAFELYGIIADDRHSIEVMLSEGCDDSASNTNSDENGVLNESDAPESLSELTDYLVGNVFGRWDIRYATGEHQPPELPDPFDPLPVCPPGMLQNADGLPMEKEEGLRMKAEGKYPLRISWEGILVDDENHAEDIVASVRDALAVIWGNRSTAIEQEACEILGVRTLRDYFAEKKSGGKFFKDHLKRYSKSRRQAPIYWPLSTESGSYTLWIYYHQLDDQILFSAVNDFVEPKLEEIGRDLRVLKEQESPDSKELERLTDLDKELTDFKEELLRLAPIWKPNLNDGVQITAAPLWKLFRLKAWQKKLKETWDKLEKGDYDWAHLAYSYWPDRVEEKCRTDKSLAIAHGLEDLFEG